MFFLIWWLLIIDCMVEFKIVYGNERVIITVPVHIKKMHHTKMIYKIIEKPVHVDAAVTPSAPAGQVGHNRGPATPDAPRRPHGDGNQTLATSGYRDRGGGHGPPPVDQRGRGYGGDYSRGPLRDGDPSQGSTAHHTRVEGVQRGPYRHADKYGSHANGAAQHHVHGPRHPVHEPRHPVHGHHAADLRHGGGHPLDATRGNFGDVMHGHFGDVMHVGDYKHGQFDDHKHGHFAANRVPVHFGDQNRGNVGDPYTIGGGGGGGGGPFGRLQSFEHYGGHRAEHFGGTAAQRGHSGGEWRALDTPGTAAGFRGQIQHGSDNLVAVPDAAAHRDLREHGFPRLLHDHRFSNPVYGNHGTGGYQVQENVADFNGVVQTVVPPPHHRPAADDDQYISPSPVDHSYSSPAVGNQGGGGGDTLDGMSSVSAIASPPTVSNVYYTLDPVLPYA